MTEYRKQTDFLKTLMSFGDSNEHRSLVERLRVAERNERCLLSACRLVAIVGLLGVSGLGYSAVLLPQFFDNSTHVVVQFFSALGLGSLMCLSVFVALWYWYRGMVNKVQDECRHVIVTVVAARMKTTVTTFYPVILEHSAAESSVTATTLSNQGGSSHGTDFWTLPKAL